MPRQRVVIVQRVLPRYRVPVFEHLRSLLDERSIDLDLVYGNPDSAFAARDDEVHVPWATEIRNRELHLGGRSLVWQPCWSVIEGADLVVVEQASKLVLNYLLVAKRRLRRRPKTALWGHGQNRSANSRSAAGEWVKRRVLTECDWWFAYTKGVAVTVEASGFDPARITALQNAVDTTQLRRALAQAKVQPLVERKRELGFGPGPVGLALGSLYPARRPEFLLAAAHAIRKELPTFELLVVGDGESRPLFDEASAEHSWIHVAGALEGTRLALAISLADVMLNPGVVGLNVLDGFACGVPFITIAGDGHGPEVDYLVDDVNGIVADSSISAADYATLIVGLLGDAERRKRLAAAGLVTADELTIEKMSANFADGIERALGI